jgi:16S rRNA processing protein RimM
LIRISKSALPALEQDEVYWHQLEGLKVVNGAGELLGVVDHLMETGANDVLVVRHCDDSTDDRERLIPFVEGETIEEIEIAEGRILVNWDKDY